VYTLRQIKSFWIYGIERCEEGDIMERKKLREAREGKGISQEELAEAVGVTPQTISDWEQGHTTPYLRHVRKLCAIFEAKPVDLDLAKQMSALSPSSGGVSNLAGLWADDLLSVYAQGIVACQDLYFSGSPHQVESLLPLYCRQTALLAQRPSPLQTSAARIASQAQHLACELLTDREDFCMAEQAGQQALCYGELAGDRNLQVASLIGLANIGFHRADIHRENIGLHRKFSNAALQTYKRAVSLLNEHITPLLKGRTYAGITEVHAMRGDLEEAMRTMGLAYKYYPAKVENDPAYQYLRASRYSLYVFGDAQSRLFLGQPKEAEKALIDMEGETNDPQIEPVTKLDLLYYQAEIAIQRGEMVSSSDILTEAAILAKKLGSRLYFNKLVGTYGIMQALWAQESPVTALEEVFQPW
jgi:DNA-binding XRE family transcriptional regulator